MRKFIIFTLILSLVLVGCTAPASGKNTTNTPDLYQSTPYEDWPSQTDPSESLESAASGPATSDPAPSTPTVPDPSENRTDETNAPQQATETPTTPTLPIEETKPTPTRLIENCVKALQEMPAIPKARIISQTADIHIEKAGVHHVEREMRTTDIADSYQSLPDIITTISDATLLTPATVNEILVQSGRLKDFLNNPEAFLEKAIELIKNNRHALAIDGIRYVKLDGKEYYVQEIFDTAELIANLDRNAVKVEHSVYDYIVYDSSTVERPFALALDNDPDVKMFFKIPDRFKIDTPIGAYNPDWAVYLTKNGEEKLYFILETKGSDSFMDLRTREQLKIHCGKKHFEALENGIEMQVATDWHEIKARV